MDRSRSFKRTKNSAVNIDTSSIITAFSLFPCKSVAMSFITCEADKLLCHALNVE